MFWYKCPHCFQFEPHVQEWLKTKADDVEFIRLPAALNPAWALLGNAYLAAKVLGVEDKIHEPLFHAIHVERKRFPDKQSISDFFVDKAGVTAKAFSSAYDSFSVRLTMTRGADFARKWGVTGVPSIIINGKYQTTAGMTKSYDRMIETIDHLVDLERKALSTTAAAVADR
ncbi:MAG TPA: thiol:disulfide interchange protein DsbA/DsbL [Chromatiaceae bacterium]|nr:thiol:disulfide interchange protein DsbA/DsbL [Chromatiaceae bacterium]